MEVSIDRILDYAGKKAVSLHKMGQRIDNLTDENAQLREGLELKDLEIKKLGETKARLLNELQSKVGPPA